MVLSWCSGACGTLGLADGLFNAAHVAAALAVGGGVHLGWDVLLLHFGVVPGGWRVGGASAPVCGGRGGRPKGRASEDASNPACSWSARVKRGEAVHAHLHADAHARRRGR
jgi:hypothetical protein